MELKKKTIHYYIRALHRDIGFLVVGLTVVYAVSGILLVYRDTGFLKEEKIIERRLASNIEEQKLGMVLHLKDFRVLKTEDGVVYFQNGTYNKSTGIAKYSANTLPFILEKFNSLHKSSAKNAVHWFSMMYGVLLLFLAVSSFWMYKKESKLFKRGIGIACTGFIGTLIIILL